MIRKDKIPMWLWQSRIVFQQTNAGGGAVKADYIVASGQVAKLRKAIAVNSGNNTLGIYVHDEDNAEIGRYAYVAAAAANYLEIPSIGAAASASGALASSQDLLIGPGEKLTIQQSAAGVQNDTLTVGLMLALYNLPTEPTISKARSTNPGDVTQGTDSISDANDLVFAGLVDHI